MNQKSRLLPQVCILAAGQGRRMGPFGEVLNKSLFPIRKKAAISHIIEKFPQESEFVIAVGYRSEQVIQYLSKAHPERKFTYAQVDNFNGVGSGPGYSALCCEVYLGESFYLVTADTLWTDEVLNLPTNRSWLAVADIGENETPNYCNILSQNNKIVEIRDKVKAPKNFKAFTGFAFVASPELFWSGLKNEVVESGKEKQLASGFQKILKEKGLFTVEIQWTDVGTEEKYLSQTKEILDALCDQQKKISYYVNSRQVELILNDKIV